MKILAGLVIVAASLLPCVLANESSAAAAAAANAAAQKAASAAASAAAAASGRECTATAVAVATVTSSAHIPCICPAVYQPVCGDDGVSYSNECILRCVSDKNVKSGRGPINVKRQGECPQRQCDCSNTKCDPICGKDGQTYGNECYLKCENERRQTLCLAPVGIHHHGPCKYPVCRCSNVIIPVCGTDGRTYRNLCMLQCQSYHNQANCKKGIWKHHNGPCKYENCRCSRIYQPLCGSDRKTYNNRCQLDCENRKRSVLGLWPPTIVQHHGRCFDCHCLPVYAPVCASSDKKTFKTYLNSCVVRCQNWWRAQQKPKLPPLIIRSHGVCPCPCPLIYRPVCASDQRTYNNLCEMNCENKRRRDLSMRLIAWRHNGRCRCKCTYCSYHYRPVCGSDGRTYWNRCWFYCNLPCNSRPGYPLWLVKDRPC